VQIAKAFGAQVTGVASTRSLARLRELGADQVIDYTREDIDAGSVRYDVVIDIAGNRRVSALRRLLTPRGTLVIVGGTGGRWTMGFERTVGAMLLAPLVQHRIAALLSNPNAADLATLATLLAKGHIEPLTHPPVSLDRAAEAIERVGRGQGPGTLVVAP
jgi:NADPH:quinone reductase-like Zn-dependent oxidoreductase